MNVESLRYLEIGHEGDNLVRSVFIDCSQWVIRYLEINQCVIAITRPDKTTYFPKIDYDPNTYTIIWNITRTDTESAGTGYYQIIGLGPDGEVIHSDCNPLVIHANMPGLAGATNEPPESSKTWYEDVIDAANEVKSAVVHNPIIGENGNWYIWNNTTLDYVDSGVASARPSDVYFGTEAPPNNEPVWINPEGGVWEMPEKKFELIKTITITEETAQVVYDFDEDIIAVMIKTVIKAKAVGAHGYVMFDIADKVGNFKGNGTGAYIENLHGTTDRNATTITLPVYGRWFTWCLGSVMGAYQNHGLANYTNENGLYDLDTYPYLKKVRVYGRLDALFGKDDIIEIWGVRANA